MFIQRVSSKGKKGQIYESILVRSSRRFGKKVVTKTLAVLTHLPKPLIAIIEQAIKRSDDINSLEQLASDKGSNFQLKNAESFGALYVVMEVAKLAGIPQALGSDHVAKLVLWQVIARVLVPAVSLLAMVRMLTNTVATKLLGIKKTFTEDHLYSTGTWCTENQPRIEKHLWDHSPKPHTGIFLYDVTSSYFEGQENELAAFGYNRDKIKGKKQVVMGLLTDSEGEPLSTQLFPGNTNDLATFKDQIHALKERFQEKNVTIVGDRGMIRAPQQAQAKEAGLHYISALHKNEIQTLLNNQQLQMEFFDNKIHETQLEDGRRLITRCNPQRREELTQSHQGYKTRMQDWIEKANKYLTEHPKAKVETQQKQALQRLKKGSLHIWLALEIKERTLTLIEDKNAYQQHTKLDGCYAIVSDLTEATASAQLLHDRYKSLSQVEADFRTLKHGHLEIRPWYVRTAANTRAHAFTAMLALKIRRRLQQAWEPLNITVEEGLDQLKQWTIMELIETGSKQTVTRLLPAPSELQTQLLSALKIEIPTQAPEKGVNVATRVKLEHRRKSAKTH
jgi:transposase